MTDTDPAVGQLEENAARRKERLMALKRKLGGEHQQGEGQAGETDQEGLPTPVFRSYKPVTEELSGNVLAPAEPSNVVDGIGDVLELAKETKIIEELDFMNLAPRKPDWDLKRDIAKKLEKLERRTARAIGEIIRERLKQEEGEEDLATAVAAGASYSAQAEEDD